VTRCNVEILAQSSTAFVLTHNFQGTHILGASRGYLSDSVASCFYQELIPVPAIFLFLLLLLLLLLLFLLLLFLLGQLTQLSSQKPKALSFQSHPGKCTLINGAGFLIWRHTFKIAGISCRKVLPSGDCTLLHIQPASNCVYTVPDPQYILAVPATRCSSLGDRAFAVAGPRAWNSLPQFVVTDYSSPLNFKKYLKIFLFSLSF